MLVRPPHTGKIGRLGKALLLAGCIVSVSLVSGQTLGASYGTSDFPKIQGCSVNQRLDHWDLILKDSASFQDFFENWSDLIEKNSCQQQDIFALQKQIDGTRNELRQRIFRCQSGDLDKLVTKLHELEFELEYLRNVMDTSDEKPGPDGKKSVVYHPDKVAALMQKSTLVKKGYISSERMIELFAKFREKYASRMKAYSDCKDRNFEALGKKWNNFVNSWAGLKGAADSASKKTAKEFNQALETPSDRTGQFRKGLLDVRVNDVTPQQNFQNLYRMLSGYDSKPGDTTPKIPPTSWEFLNRVKNEYGRYTSELSQTERQTRYEFLYGHVADSAGSAIVGEVKQLNKTILETLPHAVRTRACVKEITKKQCDGK